MNLAETLTKYTGRNGELKNTVRPVGPLRDYSSSMVEVSELDTARRWRCWYGKLPNSRKSPQRL